MKVPEVSVRRVFCALVAAIVVSLPAVGQHTGADNTAPVGMVAEPQAEKDRLSAGEILVDCQEIAGIKYVVAREWVDERPENVWPTLVNPYEFEGRICHRLKRLEMLTDSPSLSLMECTVGAMFPIPDFQYVVESRYTSCSKVEFHRVSGSFKDFRGFWKLDQLPDNKTEVTYSMYIDPGFPAPDWLVREAVRHELPNVLTGLRERVSYLKTNADAAEKRTISASNRYAALALERKQEGAGSRPPLP